MAAFSRKIVKFLIISYFILFTIINEFLTEGLTAERGFSKRQFYSAAIYELSNFILRVFGGILKS